ncbi:hypothetical protein CEXT_398321 [Caerostris extrusa]|uniref:Uncharacterized protein n=1 Tax=Caerostris extrusa TaxID=172846 RepID=A0AAV4XZT6_CAEEX|nr:hypothetical protein CEXT_398321 [Caerostris extrusa]
MLPIGSRTYNTLLVSCFTVHSIGFGVTIVTEICSSAFLELTESTKHFPPTNERRMLPMKFWRLNRIAGLTSNLLLRDAHYLNALSWQKTENRILSRIAFL